LGVYGRSCPFVIMKFSEDALSLQQCRFSGGFRYEGAVLGG